MSHQLVLELPDEVYRPLVQKAQDAGQTVEAVAEECLAKSIAQPAGYGSMRKWAGAFDSGLPDVASRHQEYLGDALYSELQGNKDD